MTYLHIGLHSFWHGRTHKKFVFPASFFRSTAGFFFGGGGFFSAATFLGEVEVAGEALLPKYTGRMLKFKAWERQQSNQQKVRGQQLIDAKIALSLNFVVDSRT